MIYPLDEFTEKVGSEILKEELNSMNKVSTSDVTLLSLALADFAACTTFLVSHDYPVAGGLFAIGVVLVYLYHKLGSA